MGKLRSALEKRLRWIVLVLVAVQPLLDVLSYFLSERGSNSISTLLRFGMLGAVALLGFLRGILRGVRHGVLFAVLGVAGLLSRVLLIVLGVIFGHDGIPC